MSLLRRVSILILAGMALVLAACSSSPNYGLPPNMRVQQQPGANIIERKSGKIAYVGPDGNIYITDQSAVSSVQITSDARDGAFYHRYLTPSWSPDSSTISFVSISGVQGEIPSDSVIYTASSEGGVISEAYYSGQVTPYYLYWSPNGEYLSFLGLTEVSHELQTISIDGSTRPTGLSSRTPLFVSWAPDSQSILAHVAGIQSSSGVLGQVTIGNEANLQEWPYDTGQFQAPAWSPDGSKVLFATANSGGSDTLVIADSTGNQPRVLTEFEGRTAFGWSPDGRYVAYINSSISTEDETPTLLSPLYVFDSKRNKTTAITEDPVLAFFWSPDGKRLAYFIPITTINEQTGEQVIQLEMRVARRSNGRSRILLLFTPTEEFLNITFLFDQYMRSATIWSPDSNYIVVATAAGGDEPIIAIMHISGALQPRGIAQGVMAFWSWE